MRSSLAEVRKPTAIRTAAATLGLLTAAGAFAPAALAADGDSLPAGTGTPTAPTEGSSSSAPVLTPAPTATDTPAASRSDVSAAVAGKGAHFGAGKPVFVGLGTSDTLPTGQTLDLSGAELRLDIASLTDASAPVQSDTCVVSTAGACAFPADTGLPVMTLDEITSGGPGGFIPGGPGGLISLADDGTGEIGPDGPDVTASTEPFVLLPPADSQFTLTLVAAPASGQLLVDPTALPTALGHTTTGMSVDDSPFLLLSVPTAYRPVGVTVAGSAAAPGAVFELCTVPGRPCTDGDAVVSATTTGDGTTADFPGRYLPGTYRVVQTAAPTGRTVDPTPRSIVVANATTVAERDVPTRAVFGTPAAPPVVPTPAAPSTSAAPAAPSTGASVSSVASPRIVPGKQQTITLSGFQPGERVHGVLHSTPVDLGTVLAAADGTATFTFTVPAGFELGVHTVTMEGLTSGTVAEATFTVTAAAATGGLAYTGAEVAPLLGLAGGLLVAGGGAMVVTRRRRTA